MDYCELGELLVWNQKSLRFRPYDQSMEYLSEREIKHYMRDCVRGLHYSK